MTTECQLCGAAHRLCESHIIPEFVYKPLYNGKHTFNVLSTQKKPVRRFEQKGIREKLLCESCEARISKYEDYAKRVIDGGIPLTVTKLGGMVRFEEIDYRKFKLFQLSILFRAGIATHPLFSRVNLADHSERLRELLDSEDPGTRMDYPCVMFGLTGPTNLTAALIDQPTEITIDGVECFRFIFASLVWVFFLTEQSLNPVAREVAVNEAGSMIMLLRPFHDLEHLNQFAKDLKDKGRI